MLFINWRRHYDVPNLVYYSNIFQRDRKAKFYFLSDTVFMLIHKYCFRRVIANYISYLFKKRWLHSCESLTHQVSVNNKYSKRVILIKRYRSKIYKNSMSHVNILLKYNVRLLQCLKIVKDIMLYLNNSVLTYYFLSKWEHIQRVMKSKYCIFTNSNAFNLKIAVKLKRNSSNILYLLLILKELKNYRINRTELLIQKINVVIQYRAIIIKQFNTIKQNFSKNQKKKIKKNLKNWENKLWKYNSKYTTINKTVLSAQNRKIQVNYEYDYELKDVENMSIEDIQKNKDTVRIKRLTTYTIAYQLLKKKVSTALHYLIICSRRTVLQSNTVLTYFAFRDLKHRKYIFNTFKNNLYVFINKLEDILWFQRKNFFRYLNSLLNSRQWLIGPTNKINLFRYITHLSFSIQDFFKLAHYRNSFYDKSKLSFFYNTIKIRKDLLYKLGKKRYKEEFILLNNNKWWVNYYIKYYYEVSRKELINYYSVLNRKYKISLVRDLFVFLEYKIPVFLNKYVSYTFSNIKKIYLNNNILNTNSNSFFYIGDYLKMEVKSTYYEKFIVFFNFLYFINPIKYQLKQQMILNIYKKVYLYFNSYLSVKSINTYKKVSFNKNMSVLFTTSLQAKKLFCITDYLYTFFNSKEKLVMKSILYLQYKSLISNWKTTGVIKKSTNDFLLMYSFSKKVTAFKLMDFKAYFIKGREKRVLNVRRRGYNSKYHKKYIYTFENIYKWLYLKSTNTDKYKVFLSRAFNEKVHKEYFMKQNNILENYDNCEIIRGLVFKPNF